MTSREGRLCRDEYTGIIAGGSVYGGTCQPALVHFVKAHLGTLQQVPSALFSVSPHAALTDDENQQEARRYVDTFLRACRAFGGKREDDEMFVQHDTTFEARSGATGRKSGILTGGQLTAATPDRSSDRLVEETAWEPDETCCVAGALHFARYDYFKRVVLKWIAGRTGLEVDETKAIEYTDWGQLTV